MTKTNRLFTDAELEQTHTLLHFSDFDSRPLVKGFTIDSPQSLDLDDALWVETHGELMGIALLICLISVFLTFCLENTRTYLIFL